MRSETKVPTLPDIRPDTHDAALSSIKESLEIREGRRGADYLDKSVTYRDLVNLGLITESQVPKK